MLGSIWRFIIIFNSYPNAQTSHCRNYHGCCRSRLHLPSQQRYGRVNQGCNQSMDSSWTSWKPVLWMDQWSTFSLARNRACPTCWRIRDCHCRCCSRYLGLESPILMRWCHQRLIILRIMLGIRSHRSICRQNLHCWRPQSCPFTPRHGCLR